jgi:hypothetical protein
VSKQADGVPASSRSINRALDCLGKAGHRHDIARIALTNPAPAASVVSRPLEIRPDPTKLPLVVSGFRQYGMTGSPS